MCWRYRIIAVLLMLSTLCGGCMGSQEIEEVSFILTIGVDKADEPGMYVYTFRIAMPRSFAGEGGGGDNKDKTKLVSVKAPAINEAVRQLSIAMSRQPEVGHASALFVSEDVAKEGIYDLVTLFLRSKVYRNTITVLVTEGKAKEVMEKNTSPFELFQYRWVDSVRLVQQFAGSYALSDVRQFYVRTADPQRAITTAYGSILEKSLDKVGKPPLEGQSAPQYSADDFPREGGTELIVVGSAIFYDWKMAGKLNTSEAMGANILKNGLKTIMTIPDPLSEGAKISVGFEMKEPDVEVSMKNGKMSAKIDALVTCELSDSASGVDYTNPENRKILEDKISEAIRSSMQAYFKATQKIGADCVQLSNHYRYKVGTWQEWASIDWPDAYRNADIEVNVKTSMKRAGLLWRYTGGSEKYDAI